MGKSNRAPFFLIGLAFVSSLAGCDLMRSLFFPSRFDFDERTVYAGVLKGSPVLKNGSTGFTSLVRSPAAERSATRALSAPLQFLYTSIKDYNPNLPTYTQNVDGSNFYVAIHEILLNVRGGMSEGYDRRFSSPRRVTSTFPGFSSGTGTSYEGGGSRAFSTSNGSYRQAWLANGSNGGTIECMLFATMTGSATNRQNVDSIGWLYRDPAGPVRADLAYIVEYTDGHSDAGAIYAPRVVLAGNSVSGDFALQGAQYGKAAGSQQNTGWFRRFEAVGNAKAGKYFVIHFTEWSFTASSGDPTGGAPSSEGWYAIASDADETALGSASSYASYAALQSAGKDPEGYGAPSGAPVAYSGTIHAHADFPSGPVPSDIP